jgi:Transposase DDE domain
MPSSLCFFLSVVEKIPDYRSPLGRVYPLGLLLLAIFVSEMKNCRRQRQRARWLAGHWRWIADIWAEWTGDIPTCRSPSQSTISRLLNNVDTWAIMQQYQMALNEYTLQHNRMEMASEVILPHYAIDGKAREGIVSEVTGRTESDVTILNVKTREVMAKRHLPDKKGEATVARHMMVSMGKQLQPGVLTCDAGFASPRFLKSVVSAGHEYIVSLKGNAGTAHDFCKSLDWDNVPIIAMTSDNGHGREELRVLRRVAPGNGLLANIAKYQNAAYVYCVESRRDDGNKVEIEARFFIGSSGLKNIDPKTVLLTIRNHWIQENGLHWVKDAILGEDDLFPQSARGSRLLGFMKDIVVVIGYSIYKSVQKFIDIFDANPEQMMKKLLQVE